MLGTLVMASAIVGVSAWVAEYIDPQWRYALYAASTIVAIVALSSLDRPNKACEPASDLLDTDALREATLAESDGTSTNSNSSDAANSCGNLVLTSLVDQPVGSIRILVGPQGAYGGRLDKNEIILEDSVVSRVHFRLSSQDDNYYLQDCGSTTGTFMYLAPLEKRRLSLNDTVKVGDTEFTIVGLQEDFWSNMKPSLRVKFMTGPMRGIMQTIGLSAVTIGRRTTCALCLESDVTVSGQHCTIEYLDSTTALEAGFYITDLKSTNGTGLRLCPSGEKSAKVLLHHKDVFGVGATKFLVEYAVLSQEGQSSVRIA
ncbi:hypothetical protein AC1031_013265 [Aphanomyces cochlioides]|nr:hypothetical protein AC1031_013265 [Aphanomyces cochlioides]